MRTLIGKVCLHPFTLSLLNFALLVLAYSSIKAAWFGESHGEDFIHSMTYLWEGYGTIVLGFGVVLEERKAMKHVFSIHQDENWTDEVSHKYGVIFVMMGLFIEILAWLVKIPNEVLNTESIELFFLNTAAAIAVGVVLLQFRFLYHLIRK